MTRPVALVGLLLLVTPSAVGAQDRRWAAGVDLGYAAFVDDATKGYWLLGASVRRQLTPRISVGPELVVMSNANTTRDRNVMLTGNVTVDLVRARRVAPFLVGGAGMFWGRDQVRGGPYWSSDPAFTAGAGVRARLNDRTSISADYRIGWELHSRLSAGAAVHW